MRAVNLIPSDARSGSVSVGGALSPAYPVLLLLAVAVAFHAGHFSSDSTLASPVLYRRVSSACRASIRVKRA